MKRIVVMLAVVASTVVATAEGVSQADFAALVQRLEKLEKENKAQAARIAELEARQNVQPAAVAAPTALAQAATDEGTTTNDTGRIWKTAQGYKYYLADKAAGIFEPLSESGLKVTPYGYLVFEGVYNTHKTVADHCTDWVLPRRNGRHNGDHQTTFSVQDSILGLQFETPEMQNGWNITGRAEFDLVGGDASDYAFHWRHLYVNAAHESGWSILFGQTWHLWKMVTPSEIDGAWMENTGHPYRRSPQIRVSYKWDWEDSSLEARAGLVKNGPGMGGDRDGDDNQDNSASAWPLLEGALIYSHDAAWQNKDLTKSWTLGVGGMYGRDKSRRENDDGSLGKSDEYDTDLIMLAASIPMWRFTFTGQVFAGENLGGVQAGIGQRVGFRDLTSKGREVSTIGGFWDLGFKVNDTWRLAVGYGFDDPTDSEARYAGGRTFNERAYADVFYKLTDNISFALEYARLRTKYYDEKHGNDDRIQFTAFYNF